MTKDELARHLQEDLKYHLRLTESETHWLQRRILRHMRDVAQLTADNESK